MNEPYGKLSEELTGPKHPARCQACGAEGEPSVDLERWRECDRFDRPTPVIVVLCAPCAVNFIVKHPRLYQQLQRHEPFPGTETLCIGCVHRQGVTCPQAKVNGGPGVTLIHPKPSDVHLCRSPRRLSGWVKLYAGPVKACDRREVAKEGANP